MKQNSFSNTALLLIESRIDHVQKRLDSISVSDDIKTGNLVEDRLLTLSVEREREYWLSKLYELKKGFRKQSKRYERDIRGVALGDKVILEKKGEDTRLEVRVADSVDLYPNERCISIYSPIGKSVLGKSPGQTLKANTPKGTSLYKIIEVERG
jgi:hypothetical protein